MGNLLKLLRLSDNRVIATNVIIYFYEVLILQDASWNHVQPMCHIILHQTVLLSNHSPEKYQVLQPFQRGPHSSPRS